MTKPWPFYKRWRGLRRQSGIQSEAGGPAGRGVPARRRAPDWQLNGSASCSTRAPEGSELCKRSANGSTTRLRQLLLSWLSKLPSPSSRKPGRNSGNLRRQFPRARTPARPASPWRCPRPSRPRSGAAFAARLPRRPRVPPPAPVQALARTTPAARRPGSLTRRRPWSRLQGTRKGRATSRAQAAALPEARRDASHPGSRSRRSVERRLPSQPGLPSQPRP